MIEFTSEAHAKILDALGMADPPRQHLRIRATAAPQGFEYYLEGLLDDDVADDDYVVDQGAFRVVLDPQSAQNLDGTQIDYRETLIDSGFRFDNPNQAGSPGLPSGPRDDLEGPVADRVRVLLDSEINPAIAAHGGHVALVDVSQDTVFLAFGGGCQGCGLVDITLKQGIEGRIKEVVPEIEHVVDTTDHASGQTPFFPNS